MTEKGKKVIIHEKKYTMKPISTTFGWRRKKIYWRYALLNMHGDYKYQDQDDEDERKYQSVETLSYQFLKIHIVLSFTIKYI